MSNPKYIYAIYESNLGEVPKLVLERAVVVKATEKQYKITGEDGHVPGLSFYCNRVVPPGKYAESAEEAWARYRDEQHALMGKHLDLAERCRARMEQAAAEAALL